MGGQARRTLGIILSGVALSAATPLPSSGQSLTAGAMVGLSRSVFSEETTPRYGLTGGIFLGAPLTPGLWAHLELDYVQKGVTDGEFFMHVDYLEVPLLFRAAFPFSISRIQPTGVLGLTVAWEVACGGMVDLRNEFPVPGTIGPLDCSTRRSRQWDAGFLVGVGHAGRLSLGNARVRIEARYTHGVYPLFPELSSSMTNRHFALVFGASVPLVG